MKKLLTILFSVLFAITTACLLVACGGGEDNDDGGQNPPHTHEYTLQIIGEDYLESPATCDSPAKYYYACTCLEKGNLTFEMGNALGHSYGEFTSNGDNTHSKVCANDSTHVITDSCTGGEATETEKAVCEVCNGEYGSVLEHTHVFDKKVISDDYLESKATCDNPAKYYYACACWAKGELTFENGSKLGHSYGEFTSNGDNTHSKVCANDSTHVITDSCSGGTATETERAVCEVCHSEYGAVLGHTHNYNKKVASLAYIENPATCQKKSTYYFSCSCGLKGSLTFEYGNYADHKYTNYVYNDDATCAEDGTETAYCDYTCGESDTRTKLGTKLEHSYTNYVYNDDATCTEDGTETAYCDYTCGENDTRTKVGTALNHDYVEDENLRFEDSNGLDLTLECSVCDDVKEINDATLIDSVEATCGREGKNTYEYLDPSTGDPKTIVIVTAKIPYHKLAGFETKLYLDKTYEYDEIKDMLDNGLKYIAHVPVTCVGAGPATFSCEICCDGTEVLLLNVYGNHDYIEDESLRFEDTNGLDLTFVCSVCDDVKEINDATLIDSVEATCGREGKNTYEYLDLSTGDPKTIVIATARIPYHKLAGFDTEIYLDRDYEAKKIEAMVGNGLSFVANLEPATCIETGYATFACEVCCYDTEVLMLSVYGDHDYKNGQCVVCEMPQPGSQGLEYRLINNGTEYEVASIGDCTDTDIIIPSTYNNKPVTSIGEWAFDSCSSLTSVTLSFGITSIGDYAFWGCELLAKIDMSESVSFIGDLPFSGCKIKEARIPTSIIPHVISNSLEKVVINGGEAIESYAFWTCGSLKNIVISSSVTSIGESAFRNCYSLESVTFEENSKLISIESLAFAYCVSLRNIILPDSLKSIAVTSFSNCPYSLFNIEGDVKYLASKDNKCFAVIGVEDKSFSTYIIKEGTKIIADGAFFYCDRLTNIEIPTSITHIGRQAFDACTALVSIEIPDNVISIGAFAFQGCTKLASISFGSNSKLTFIEPYAFGNCSALTSIVIPYKITYIGYQAFEFCTKLENIFFNGTLNEWRAVEKDNDWNYNVPATYVQCSDGKVYF